MQIIIINLYGISLSEFCQQSHSEPLVSAYICAFHVCPPLLLTLSCPHSQAASMSGRKVAVYRMLSKVGTAESPRTSPSWNIWSLLRTFKYPLTSTKSRIPAWEQCHFWRSKEPQSWYFTCKHVKSYDTTCTFNIQRFASDGCSVVMYHGRVSVQSSLERVRMQLEFGWGL